MKWNGLFLRDAVFRGSAAVRVRHDTRHLPNAEGLERRVRQTTGQLCRPVRHYAGQRPGQLPLCGLRRSTPVSIILFVMTTCCSC